MLDIYSLIDGIQRIAIVGVAKNCGKTTTLNALLAGLSTEPVGLLSVGIDGEPEDMLIHTPKPTIFVSEGQWVVTARDGFEVSSAAVEYVAPLGIDTPMGPVSLARVTRAGTILLAGMRHAGDIERATALLLEYGASHVLIDGAYGRTVAAQARLCDGVLISTGAVVSPVAAEVAQATAALANRFGYIAPTASWQRELLERSMSSNAALLGGPDGEVVELPSKSALVGLSKGRALWRDDLLALAVPGLVSPRVLEELLAVPAPKSGARRALLLRDGTTLQAPSRLVSRVERGWDIHAAAAPRLLGVSYNPTSVAGPSILSEELDAALRVEFGAGVALFDPVELG